jgi:hypothetical protein
MATGERLLTLGDRRVRLSFNPSGNEAVDRIKRIAADGIDLCQELRTKPGMDPLEAGSVKTDMDVQRLLSLAQTAFEEAAMWATKAATA